MCVSNIFSQKKDKNRDYYFFDDDYLYKSKPTVDISYGYSKLTLKNSGITFSNSGMVDLKLGYTFLAPSRFNKRIIKYETNFLYGAQISPNLYSSKNLNYGNGRTWSFGAGTAKGYGYGIGKSSAIILYNSNSFFWTKYDDGIATELFLSNGQYNTINDYKGTFRFGTGTEAGILIPTARWLNLQLQFDRTLVFPRHLVWKQFGIMLIEGASQAIIDTFIKSIMKSSPFAGPIMNFVLKNALSYGIYELRRDKMNWPFQSTQPMLFDTFKGGFSLMF